MLVATIAVVILLLVVIVVVLDNKKKVRNAADKTFQEEPAAGMVGIEMPNITTNPLAISQPRFSTSAFVLTEWLNDPKVGMGEYEASLRAEGFDNVSSLRDLEKDDLKEIDVVKLAHRKAIMKAIALL